MANTNLGLLTTGLIKQTIGGAVATLSTAVPWTDYAPGLPTAAAGGTVDAITATYAPAVTLTNGTRVILVAAGANTGAVTFVPNGLASKAIVKNVSTALSAGDIPGAGYPCDLQYNNTAWILLNPYMQAQMDLKAPIASPTFTGTLTVPVGLTGVLKAATGVMSVATAGMDYAVPITTSLADLAYSGAPITGYAGEALAIGDVCYLTTIAPPVAPTVAAEAGTGTCTTGNHLVKISLVTALGESIPGTASAIVTCGAGNDDKILVTVIPTGLANVVTARKIYMTEAAGATYYYVGTLAGNANTTYDINVPDATLVTQGAMPTINTSGTYYKCAKSLTTTLQLPAVVMATGTIAVATAGVFLKAGYIRNDAWAAMTVGAFAGTIWVSETGTSTNTRTQTCPTTASVNVQNIGYAEAPKIICFDPVRTLIKNPAA